MNRWDPMGLDYIAYDETTMLVEWVIENDGIYDKDIRRVPVGKLRVTRAGWFVDYSPEFGGGSGYLLDLQHKAERFWHDNDDMSGHSASAQDLIIAQQIGLARRGEIGSFSSRTVRSIARGGADQIIMGEGYEGETTIAGTGGEIGVGCIPVLGQIADARDTYYSAGKVYDDPSSGWAWASLGGSVVGWLPGLGDWIKSGVKSRRALAEGTEQAVGSGRKLTVASSSQGRHAVNEALQLTSRQSGLLSELAETGTTALVRKSDVSMSDLAALTAKTGDEFGMFTLGGRRMIVRGTAGNLGLSENRLVELAMQGWRFSGHTHPGTIRNVLMASGGDRNVLKLFIENGN